MVEAVIAKRIEAPADDVWALVNWKGCEALMPIPGQMDSVRFEGDGPGARRIFALDQERLGGGSIVEELVFIDPKHRFYQYIIADNGPLPWTDYKGEIRVTPCGPDACALKFAVEITPLDMSDEECRNIFITHCLMDVARIKDHLGIAAG
ncbi:SRPBCC family protein [Parasphingopyxis sp.]|uniref:SRPBCC family protein n=1 Tax=Parasphingopyxis sp. TaxID=1920299 RepID=UPI0026360922|nr:SRPBCC family protein [Parasphingopyxis sp.]